MNDFPSPQQDERKGRGRTITTLYYSHALCHLSSFFFLNLITEADLLHVVMKKLRTDKEHSSLFVICSDSMK